MENTWNGVAVFELHVQLNILALVNTCFATELVKLFVGTRVEGNVPEIHQMNLILLEGQRKQQNSLCLSRYSKFRSSEYMSGHL